MRRFAEPLLFVPLAVGLHVAAFHFAGLSDGGGQGQTGAEGQSSVTLAALPPQVDQLLHAWDTPPDVADAAPAPTVPHEDGLPDLPPSQDRPEPLARPKVAHAPLPDASPVAPLLPAKPVLPVPIPPEWPRPAAQPDNLPPAAKPEVTRRTPQPARPEAPATEVAPRVDPPARPKPETKARTPKSQKKAQAQPATRAKGAGKTGGAEAQAKTKAASLSKGQRDTLRARWISQVRAKAQARLRYPNSARRAGIGGKARVAVTLDITGRVLGVTLQKSAGHAVLDKAALAAAQARKYPKAPKGLPAGSYTFVLPLSFTP